MPRDGLYLTLQQSAGKAGWTPHAVVAQPAEGCEPRGRRWLPQLDWQPGNPCIGIAVACALSSPFWAALVLLVYLVA